MCTVCGCSEDPKVEVKGHHHHHHHDHHHHHHDHDHGRRHSHSHEGTIDFGAGPAGVHVAGQSQSRLVTLERDILAKNDSLAEINRRRLADAGVVAINLMSSPGSGKTTLLVETLKALKDRIPLAVIEGDQQTSNDAERIRQTGVPAIQVNTGKGCHLDADMIGQALDHLDLPRGGLLFIENVGNLVCPAGFDLGEALRVVLASVTEGEDKPLKYPEMFASADLMLISKTDLVPHLDVDVTALIDNARKVKPDLAVMGVSARGRRELDDWLDWLIAVATPESVAAE